MNDALAYYSKFWVKMINNYLENVTNQNVNTYLEEKNNLKSRKY